jgi:hypothetical protein
MTSKVKSSSSRERAADTARQPPGFSTMGVSSAEGKLPLRLERGLQSGDSRVLTLPPQQEHRLLAKKFQNHHGIDRPIRCPLPSRAVALDLAADLVAKADEVADRAEVDVRRIVPGIGQVPGHRHAAPNGWVDLRADIYDRLRQRCFQHSSGLSAGMSRGICSSGTSGPLLPWTDQEPCCHPTFALDIDRATTLELKLIVHPRVGF